MNLLKLYTSKPYLYILLSLYTVALVYILLATTNFFDDDFQVRNLTLRYHWLNLFLILLLSVNIYKTLMLLKKKKA